MLAVSIGGGIMVADDGGRGQSGQHIVVEITVILVLVVMRVDLIAGRQQEGNVGEAVVCFNEVDRFSPAGGIAACVPAGADPRVAHKGKGEVAASARCEVIYTALIAAVFQLIVICCAGL